LAVSVSERTESAAVPLTEVLAPSEVRAPEIEKPVEEGVKALAVSASEPTESAAVPLTEVLAPSEVKVPKIEKPAEEEVKVLAASVSASRGPAHAKATAVVTTRAVTVPAMKRPNAARARPAALAPVKRAIARTLPFPKPAAGRPAYRYSRRVAPRVKRLGAEVLAYWKEVGRSFVKDWKRLLTVFARRRQPISGELRRKVVAPVTKWLRQPITRNREL